MIFLILLAFIRRISMLQIKVRKPEPGFQIHPLAGGIGKPGCTKRQSLLPAIGHYHMGKLSSIPFSPFLFVIKQNPVVRLHIVRKQLRKLLFFPDNRTFLFRCQLYFRILPFITYTSPAYLSILPTVTKSPPLHNPSLHAWASPRSLHRRIQSPAGCPHPCDNIRDLPQTKTP